MDQNSKIKYYNNQYNSMFDDSESEEEIKDLAKDSHNALNIVLSKTIEPELFDCIINMMNFNHIQHKSNRCLTQNELNKIKILTSDHYDHTPFANSFFKDFNPLNGDFSIIFKYLKNVEIINSDTFIQCGSLKTITIPKSVKYIGLGCFQLCENLENVIMPTIEEIAPRIFYFCPKLKSLTIPKKYKNKIFFYDFGSINGKNGILKRAHIKNITYI